VPIAGAVLLSVLQRVVAAPLHIFDSGGGGWGCSDFDWGGGSAISDWGGGDFGY